MRDCEAIISYLAAFGVDESLYENPIFTMGLLRLLTADARELVFTLLVSSVHILRLKSILNIKESIRIILHTKLAYKDNDILVLCDKFRRALLRGFCLESIDFLIIQAHKNIEHIVPEENNDSALRLNTICWDEESLGKVAIELSGVKFQSLLQSIVSNDSRLMYGIKDILIFCNLIDPMHQITRKGFEFLLNSRVDQHWIILLSSIKYFAHRADSGREMHLQLMEMCVKNKSGLFGVKKWTSWHSFLNSVGVLHLVSLSEEQKDNNMISFKQSMEDMAVGSEVFEAVGSMEAHARNLDSSFSYFYLNTAFLFDSINPLKINSEKYIFLETNFKIYAYTNKDYEKNILNLFSRTIYTLPNLVKAQLDEESVVSAYYKGITAGQILKYLREFAYTVPSSVANQILIWENRQHRVTTASGVLYSDFLHMSDYLQVLRFLERNNALLLKDESKRIIVGTEETHFQVTEILKKL
ncbi:transcription initiation factor TFIIH subunit 4 [Pancytospora epiphaga]|nr:transcription initiation factor TFIIH subunit 4 [Pancytospora epiphaga]